MKTKLKARRNCAAMSPVMRKGHAHAPATTRNRAQVKACLRKDSEAFPVGLILAAAAATPWRAVAEGSTEFEQRMM